MAEHFPGAIQIGGAVSRRLAPDLAQAITDVGALAEAEAAPAVLHTAEDLVAALDPENHVLRLYDHQASYGAFFNLETWLRDHGIPYDRQSDARYEYDGQAVSFRAGIGLVERTATQDGAATVPVEELRPVHEELRAALAEPTAETVKAAIDALDKVIGPDIPSLPPFTFID